MGMGMARGRVWMTENWAKSDAGKNGNWGTAVGRRKRKNRTKNILEALRAFDIKVSRVQHGVKSRRIKAQGGDDRH